MNTTEIERLNRIKKTTLNSLENGVSTIDNRKSTHANSTTELFLNSEDARKKSRENIDKLCRKHGLLE